MSQTRPAWYPDPSGRFAQRYHDGNRWTEHVLDADGANHRDAPTGPPAGVGHQQPVARQLRPEASRPPEHVENRFAPSAAQANGASRAAPTGGRPPGPQGPAPAARSPLPGTPSAPSAPNAPPAPSFGQVPTAPDRRFGVGPSAASAPSVPSVPSAPAFGQAPSSPNPGGGATTGGFGGPGGAGFGGQGTGGFGDPGRGTSPAAPAFAQQYPGPGNVPNGWPLEGGAPAAATGPSVPGTGILPGGITLTVGVITAGAAAFFALLSLFVLGFQRFSAGGSGDSFSLSDVSGPGAPFLVDIYGSLGRLLALAVISAAVLATLKLPQLARLGQIPNLKVVVAGACGFMLLWHGAAMFSSPDLGGGGDLGLDLGLSVSPAFGAWLGLLAWIGLIAAQFLDKPVGSTS